MHRRETCPNCRLEVTEDDIVPKLYFNTDDGQGAEFKQQQCPAKPEEKPWYEKYKEELLLGGGVVFGVIAGAVVTGLMGSQKKKHK